ncbi:DNA polymerase III subunit alpha [Oceanobacillus massiliensis]|uniref:DNA polymerase III subunit alpha n=2 Tax=Oceanobacillus massiliensis TaxID=1465765 RepID=UPI000289B1AA|nr:DNA polymerase III subunit alpha [Oceanobacillus massiliensis]
MSFTHLQVKSGYSLMNSTITIPKLVERAHELNFDALALTDEGVLYGAIPFYRACQSYGIKPIIGMTVFVQYEENAANIPCILLAKSAAGYHQLIKLSTAIQFGGENAIGMTELASYKDDIICILPINHEKLKTLIRDDSPEKAFEYINKWKSIYTSDDFYLGIDYPHSAAGKAFNESVKDFQQTYRIPAAAINDVIYLNEKDDIAYDCLQSMKKGDHWGMKVSDAALKKRHLRSEAEMVDCFSSFWPEALDQTESIKNKCNIDLDFDQRHLPSFPVPDGIDAHDYLTKQCFQNAEKRYAVLTDEVKARLNYELSIIETMKFSDYFLIVADFISYAKSQHILVGPGRGSSAGSIVAYVLGITDVDPIKYQLLFERFLNPERRTMPDIDVDFSDARRDEVIEYVRNKYGGENVAQIITFGTFAARSLIRELIKTMDIDQQDAAFLLKEIPLQTKKNIAEIVKDSKELNQYVKGSPELKLLFAVAVKLEGLPRHISTHAAGVVISEQPLTDYVPLTVGANQTHLTQFPMNDLEAVGLLKMDFLGLRNLTLLEKIINSIKYTANKQISLERIPDNDEQTYQLLRTGRTNGVFQLESQGMKQVLTSLKPTSFEDIVAVNALFRPGPMDFIPVYIARKHGKEQVTYPHPDLKPILEKTFGVLVYQEQIMQIANRIAGFTLGEADILRRAVSKKKQDMMDAQKKAFIDGCLTKGYDLPVAEEIFSWIVKFSNYGFPRSHAVAYSKISYQLAFLKAHYPASFFAELLSSTRNQQEKWSAYMQELKSMGLELLPPNINRSFGKYTVEKNQIRMGLSSIKGVGNQSIAEIIRVRKDGPFKNLFDFCLRVSPKTVNRTTLENLIIAGAFDETNRNRASLLASIDQAMEQGELFSEFSGQPSLFQNGIELEVDYADIEDFSQVKKLADEKELLGMYISSHPLKEFRIRLRANGHIPLKNAANLVGKKEVATTAIIQSIKTIRTKRGERMAFLTIGDEHTEMDAVVFPDLFREANRWLHEEMIISIKGKVESRNNKLQWVISMITPFDENNLSDPPKKRLFIKSGTSSSEHTLKIIKQIAEMHPGVTPVIIYDDERGKSFQLADAYSLHTEHSCLKELNRHFGKDNVVLKKME